MSAADIGGMASSHNPESNGQELNHTEGNSVPIPPSTKNESSFPQPIAPANAPIMSVLRRDSSESNPSLQFESASGLLDEMEDSDDDIPRSGEKRSGRRKIKIEYIEDKSRRHITFSKRKAGIMKKVLLGL